MVPLSASSDELARRRYLVTEVFHVNVSAEARVVGQVPSGMLRVFVNHNVIAVPAPIVDIAVIVAGHAEIISIEPEAVTVTTAQAVDVISTEAVEAAILPGAVLTVVTVVAAVIVANPFIVIVDVRRIRVAFAVGIAAIFSAVLSVIVLIAAVLLDLILRVLLLISILLSLAVKANFRGLLPDVAWLLLLLLLLLVGRCWTLRGDVSPAKIPVSILIVSAALILRRRGHAKQKRNCEKRNGMFHTRIDACCHPFDYRRDVKFRLGGRGDSLSLLPLEGRIVDGLRDASDDGFARGFIGVGVGDKDSNRQ